MEMMQIPQNKETINQVAAILLIREFKMELHMADLIERCRKGYSRMENRIGM